jgi:hypothetical protein
MTGVWASGRGYYFPGLEFNRGSSRWSVLSVEAELEQPLVKAFSSSLAAAKNILRGHG